MLLRIDPTNGTPLFDQVTTQVRLAILHGDIRAGERLPAAKDLATSLDVNVHTVLKAYQALHAEGLVELRRGRGAVVLGPAAAEDPSLRSALAAVAARAKELGISTDATTTLLKEALR